MARSLSSNVNPQDVAAIDLSRVLLRLEHKILSSDADQRLLHSSYERKKASGVSLISQSIELYSG